MIQPDYDYRGIDWFEWLVFLPVGLLILIVGSLVSGIIMGSYIQIIYMISGALGEISFSDGMLFGSLIIPIFLLVVEIRETRK